MQMQITTTLKALYEDFLANADILSTATIPLGQNFFPIVGIDRAGGGNFNVHYEYKPGYKHLLFGLSGEDQLVYIAIPQLGGDRLFELAGKVEEAILDPKTPMDHVKLYETETADRVAQILKILEHIPNEKDRVRLLKIEFGLYQGE